MNHSLILDVGGTKTHIAEIYVNLNGTYKLVKDKIYQSQNFDCLEDMILDFMDDLSSINTMSIAVAGPVISNRAALTNIKWSVDVNQVKHKTGVNQIYLINDLEASAMSIPYLKSNDLLYVYNNPSKLSGNIAVISPGTGLGEAGIFWDGKMYHPFATEGGHCDFAPRDNLDMQLLTYLKKSYLHVSWERVLSGMGIINIFEFLLTNSSSEDTEWINTIRSGDMAANISSAAIKGHNLAIGTMRLFIKYLAIESSNMVLKLKATGGLYIGGGIVPKIWNEEYQDLFLTYFFNVGRLEPLLKTVDVNIIKNPTSVLAGAAMYIVSHNKYLKI